MGKAPLAERTTIWEGEEIAYKHPEAIAGDEDKWACALCRGNNGGKTKRTGENGGAEGGGLEGIPEHGARIAGQQMLQEAQEFKANVYQLLCDSCHIWLFGLEEGTGKLPNVIREEGCTAYVRPILPSLVHPEDTVQREESGWWSQTRAGMGSSTCQEGLAQAKEVLGDGVIKLKLIPVDFYLEFIQNDLSCAIDKQIFAGMRNTGPDPASQGQMQRFASKVQLWSFPVAKIGLVSGHFARLLKNNVSCQDHPARYVPPPMPPAGMAHAHQNAAEELAEEEEPEEDPEVGEPKITPARHEVQQEAPATLQDTILMEQMVFQTRRTTDLKECLAGVLATNSEGAGGGKWPDPLEEARFHRRQFVLQKSASHGSQWGRGYEKAPLA
ncbi:hypothetical protein AK812_SmicGene7945 [Symbiodinium microadriaticum]|uniref:Uncharacterized protein n=1 Tax=Symbiodinium microadriaticum TaxID=2951 RepID=A0A1Q9EMA3_SYMMI|nr:hypothetical protein AK812_SmicGene7945 [Symbiodinium microadriaticum]